MELTEKAMEAQRAYKRKYREQHREQINAYSRQWRAANKDRVRSYNANYWKRKAEQLPPDQETT